MKETPQIQKGEGSPLLSTPPFIGVGGNATPCTGHVQDTYGDLKEFLKNKGFIINFNVSLLEVALEEHTPVLLIGPPGVGKTTLVELLAEYLTAELEFYQCTLNSSEEDLLFRYIPDENTKSGIRVLPNVLTIATKMSMKNKVVVCLDEFDKTRPTADSFLLDYLQNARISARFEGEHVIQGNKNNLYIFLTSNRVREFSEPLLRRLLVLELKPLAPETVKEILLQEFPAEIVELLVKIYSDTLSAGLRKPATLQELKTAGKIMMKNPSMELMELLTSTIIKYSDDLEKFKQFLQSGRATEPSPQDGEDLGQYYLQYSSETEQTEQAQPKVTVQDILPSMSPRREVQEQEDLVVYAKVPKDEGYSDVIKKLNPEPSDDPAVLGKKWEVWQEHDKLFLVSKEPLSLEEFKKLSSYGEYFVDDTINRDFQAISQELIKSDITKILSYSAGLLIVEVAERFGDYRAVVKLEDRGAVTHVQFKYVGEPRYRFLDLFI